MIVALIVLSNLKWSSDFTLHVTLVNSSGQAVTDVGAAVFGREDFEKYIGPMNVERDLSFCPVQWEEGKSFAIETKTAGQSWMGIEPDHREYFLLFVRVQFADGATEVVTSEIPEGRYADADVTVEIKKHAEKKSSDANDE